jgi:hypothetical protein
MTEFAQIADKSKVMNLIIDRLNKGKLVKVFKYTKAHSIDGVPKMILMSGRNLYYGKQ